MPNLNSNLQMEERRSMTDFIKCECGENVYSLPEAQIEGGLYECMGCHKFPAIDLDGKLTDIKNLLNIKKYGNQIHEWITIDDNLKMVKVETSFEEKVLQCIASNRDVSGFMGFYKPLKGVLLANENEFVGCIVWFRGIHARLNWIFIRKEYRRKGYGIKFLKSWVEQIADKINDKYEIESPNKASAGLLFKLGHLKMEGDRIVEVKCIILESPGWSPDMMFYDF